ncbi:SIR2 family protein [Comamonas sp. JUb58]|uniref:SIR2 family NAD-dependent protein deacylase n=1 Tax=Comamonas sp. JUb58 TaxID=2485114 RepID=UPI00105D8AC7|nr:SIR2 family protein [Comamonas sp. JUb58]TDS85146.1 SIR2-like protein [Comamonas sp. JUb58]
MEKLKQVLSQEDTIIFIGSGLSLWSGLPSWSQLIEDLAKFVESFGVNAGLIRAEATRGDLLQAASYGFDRLTKQQIGEFIREACQYGKAEPHEIHKKIVSLGTRCFVTTNYDNLLEEALRKWRPNNFFRAPITNKNLTETAEIVSARALDFIFKPHGDAADSDSIILTREQYRQLLPQGERHSSLETLKLLLASRPVVYFGFGLRDPDFLYIKDLLSNIYKGGTRDHYAIMPDISEAESDYWRRHYGIHLITYPTTVDTNKRKNHDALLHLIDSFIDVLPPKLPLDLDIPAKESTSDVVLSLARHAARLERYSKANPELPIRVQLDKKNELPYHSLRSDTFNGAIVDRFLDNGPNRAILIGLPGSGKSYSLKRSTARLADKLHDICLSETFEEKSAVIPVFVDLKLYCGDIVDLINQNIPQNMSLSEMAVRFKLKFYLDSFNEMPREYRENGAYEVDFSDFEKNYDNSSIVITSRTVDGLEKFEFPIYHLDLIDENVLTTELQKLNIFIEGRFETDMRRLLQKPFYFHLVSSGAISLPHEAHPRDIYQSLLNKLYISFHTRFSPDFNLENILATVAYDAINRGEEAYATANILEKIEKEIAKSKIQDIKANDIVNWLISRSILIPYSNGRIAFIHQSITEYLAATQLSFEYQINPLILEEKLTLTRWDQALFLTLSLLPESEAYSFFKKITDIDFDLALNAVKYLEFNRDDIVSKLLDLIPEKLNQRKSFTDYKIESHLEFSLPISECHEQKLRFLMSKGHLIGAAALNRLIEIKGISVKEEALDLLVQFHDDYNFCCNGIADSLTPFFIDSDIKSLKSMADSLIDEIEPESDDYMLNGFISGSALLLSKIEIPLLEKSFLCLDEDIYPPDIHARIACESLWHRNSTPALELAANLLLRNINHAATSIYFLAKSESATEKLSWDCFDSNHVLRLISLAEMIDEKSWALRALHCLCKARPDLAQLTKAMALLRSGISKAALLFCVSQENHEDFFEAMRELLDMTAEERAHEQLHLIEKIDISWVGQEKLFIEILKLRDPILTISLLEQLPIQKSTTLGFLEIGDIEWWLDWMHNNKNSSIPKFFLFERLSWMFFNLTSRETRHSFVEEFNNSNSNYRNILANSILIYHTDLTTDDFSKDAIRFLLENLEIKRDSGLGRNLLAQTATEQFIQGEIIPMISKEKIPLQTNLRSILKAAGARHGKRYIVD